MPIPLSGDPVRIVFQLPTDATSTSTAGLGIFYPGTNNVRTLQPYEQLAIESVLIATGALYGGTLFITTLPASTASASIAQANCLLITQFGANGSYEWHDDGTGALTGLPGVVPSVFGVFNSGGSTGSVTGTGLIVNTAPAGQAQQRCPQYANLTPNIAGLM